MGRTKRGGGSGRVIIPPGIEIWPHELDTAKALAADGRTVEFVAPVDGEGVKTADASMGGVLWEFKAPRSTGPKSLDRVLRRASRQSRNVVIDAARMGPLPDPRIEADLRKAVPFVRGLKRVILVRKNRDVVVIL